MIVRWKKIGFLLLALGIVSCDSAESQAPPPGGSGGAPAVDAGDASQGGGGGKDGGSHVDASSDASVATCSCTPNDVRKCSQDAGGQPITFPGFDGNGNPLGKYCKLGKETCTANGQWGPCIGAVGPLPADLCDGLDENCNGKVDLA